MRSKRKPWGLVAGVTCLVAAVQPASAEPPESALRVFPSPLAPVALACDGTAVRHQLDRQTYSRIKCSSEVVLRQVEVAPGRALDLRLHQFVVTDQRTRWVRDGGAPAEPPDVVLLRGEVDGEPDSHAFLSLSPSGSCGYIDRQDERYVLTTFAPHAERPDEWITVFYAAHDFPPEPAAAWACEPREIPGRVANATDPSESVSAGTAGDGGIAGGGQGECLEAVVAIETDYEFFVAMQGQNRANAYIVALTGAVSDIYERDVNVKLVIGYSRIWTTPDDPYEASTLEEFQNYWNTNMSHVQRNSAHMFSRHYQSGGVAYVGGLCGPGYDYALSGLNCAFPRPPRSYSNGTWDVYVVAHEWGHNFGTWHTHDYVPPIDICALDCAVNDKGTLMSYCHTCAGGMKNILLGFHRRVEATIVNFVAATGCLSSASACETILRGDMNCDGNVDGADIDGFFLALADPDAYRQAYPLCDLYIVGDVDSNGHFDGSDIWAFFQKLQGD